MSCMTDDLCFYNSHAVGIEKTEASKVHVLYNCDFNKETGISKGRKIRHGKFIYLSYFAVAYLFIIIY